MPVSAIPIANLYYLLAYAWDCLEEAAAANASELDGVQLQDLFARLLVTGVSHLLKRGLLREYAGVHEELAGVRGRIDIGASIRAASFERGRAWCSYDELSHDAVANRIIKTTLRSLAGVEGLSPQLGSELRELYRRMPGVHETLITRHAFSRLSLGNHSRFYRLPLRICALIHRCLFVDEATGEVRFRDFTRDDRAMRRLFERFLRRFYAKEQASLAVTAPQLSWRARGAAESRALIPVMRTDVVLSNGDRMIVADAKYYSETLSEHFGKRSIRPGHLYQLYSYLRHAKSPTDRLSGLLIYPRTSATVRVDVTIDGYPIRLATVNLSQPWEKIHDDLLVLIEP